MKTGKFFFFFAPSFPDLQGPLRQPDEEVSSTPVQGPRAASWCCKGKEIVSLPRAFPGKTEGAPHAESHRVRTKAEQRMPTKLKQTDATQPRRACMRARMRVCMLCVCVCVAVCVFCARGVCVCACMCVSVCVCVDVCVARIMCLCVAVAVAVAFLYDYSWCFLKMP